MSEAGTVVTVGGSLLATGLTVSGLTSGLIPQAGVGGLLANSALGTSGITGTLTLSKSGSTARTATFPDAAITVAGLSLAQSWSGIQTFAAASTIIGTDPTGSETLRIGGGAVCGAVGFGGSDNLRIKAAAGTANARIMRDLYISAHGGSFDIGSNIYYSGTWVKDTSGKSSSIISMAPSGTAGQYSTLTYYSVAADGASPVALFATDTAGRFVIGTDPGGSDPLRIGGALTISSTRLMSTKTSFTNGAAAAAGTLTNAPAVGNPTKWIPIDDNGTTRYIPAW